MPGPVVHASQKLPVDWYRRPNIRHDGDGRSGWRADGGLPRASTIFVHPPGCTSDRNHYNDEQPHDDLLPPAYYALGRGFRPKISSEVRRIGRDRADPRNRWNLWHTRIRRLAPAGRSLEMSGRSSNNPSGTRKS